MENKISKDDIDTSTECLESSPCQHHVVCKKLGINRYMRAPEVVELYSKFGLLDHLSDHFNKYKNDAPAPTSVSIMKDDIDIDLSYCLESYPCQHYVVCPKLGIKGTMNGREINRLFKQHNLYSHLDEHFHMYG